MSEPCAGFRAKSSNPVKSTLSKGVQPSETHTEKKHNKTLHHGLSSVAFYSSWRTANWTSRGPGWKCLTHVHLVHRGQRQAEAEGTQLGEEGGGEGRFWTFWRVFQSVIWLTLRPLPLLLGFNLKKKHEKAD